MLQIKRNQPLLIPAIVHLLMIGISFYLVYHHYELVNGHREFGSFCSINETIDCDSVNTSKFATLFNIPLAAFQLGYSVFSIFIILYTFINQNRNLSNTINYLVISSFFGALGSLGTLYISALLLNKFCIMCSSLQLLNILVFITCVALARRHNTFKQIINAIVIVKHSLGLFAAIIVVHALTSQWHESLPYDALAFKRILKNATVIQMETDGLPELRPQANATKQNLAMPRLTIVEFADFQCPACALAARKLHHLLQKYDSKIRIYFRNMPFDSSCNPHAQSAMHPQACLAAKAVLCADKQNQFTNFYEKLFAEQKKISRDNVLFWAAEAKLDATQFERCLDDDQTLARLRQDIEVAHRLGINSTPTFIVNGIALPGILGEEQIDALLEHFER